MGKGVLSYRHVRHPTALMIAVYSGDCVRDLKEKIQEQEGVSPAYIEVYSNGERMGEGRELTGDLEVRFNLRGGIDYPSDPIECFCTPGAVCCYCFQCRLHELFLFLFFKTRAHPRLHGVS